MKKVVKINKKELEKFVKDPFKWVALNVGKEIYIPKQKPKHRYFVVRFDKSPVDWKNPDFVEELTEQEIKTLEVYNGKWNTVETLTKWLLGGKN